MARRTEWLALALVVGCATAEEGTGAEDGRRNDALDVDAGDDRTGTPDDVATDADAVPDADAVLDGDADASTDARDDGTVDDGVSDVDVAVRDDGGADDGTTEASDGGGLDPALALPDGSGTPCSTPSSMGECPGIEVCRFYSTTEGRCESCSPCGNLGDFCSASSECDILFMCYAGRCTNFCQLGTYMCGAITDCIDVGHATWGVCRP